jgi:hypothetical protein
MDFYTDEEVVLEGAVDDMLFAAARRISLEASSTDDVFLAGATITVNGARADRLTMAGESLIFTSFQAEDVVAAGRQLQFLGGAVADDVLAAGAEVTLADGFEVGGSAMLAGADVIVEAPVGGELRAAGERVRLNALVDGDVELSGNRVIVGPETRIRGGLTHRAEEIEIAPEAQIDGEVVALEPRADVDAGGAIAGMVVIGIALFAGVLVLFALLAGSLPALMRSSAERMRGQPLATLGAGFLIAFAAPVVMAILAVTVIGVPIAIVLAIMLAAAAPLAITATVYFIGRQFAALAHRSAAAGEPGFGARAGWTALGALALLIVGLIPFIGGLAWLAAYVFGLGAVVILIARTLSSGPSAATA